MNAFFGGIILLFAIFYGLTRPKAFSDALGKLNNEDGRVRMSWFLGGAFVLTLTEMGAIALGLLGLKLMGVL